MNLKLLAAFSELDIKEYFNAGQSDNGDYENQWFFRLMKNWPQQFIMYNRISKRLVFYLKEENRYGH